MFVYSGVITVIGIAIWGGQFKGNSDPPAYLTTLGVCSALLAILAGIFAILDIAGVKGK